MAKKKKDNGNLSKAKIQNLAAKHSRNMGGAGQHVDKTGEKAPRVRQKRAWKKGIQYENTMIVQANSMLMYNKSDEFDQALKDVEQEFGINLSEGFSAQQKADMAKLISQYKSDGAGDIGNDLEMLEYNPDEVEPMIAYIRDALKQ